MIKVAQRGNAEANFGLAKPEWRPLALGCLFLLDQYQHGVGLSSGYSDHHGRDLGFEKSRNGELGSHGYAGRFAIQGIATAFRSYLFTVTGERIVAQLRKSLFASIVEQETGFFDDRKTGELTNRLSADTQVLQNAVSVNISMALRFGAAALGGLGLLFYTSPILTSIMLLVVPPVTLGSIYVGRLVRRISKKTRDALAKAGEVAEETLSGIRTVRTFNREARERDSYSRKSGRCFLAQQEAEQSRGHLYGRQFLYRLLSHCRGSLVRGGIWFLKKP